jgi:hypothetical protein
MLCRLLIPAYSDPAVTHCCCCCCRKPWEHVISGTIVAYTFSWIVEQEDRMIKQIEDHYARLGKTPASNLRS